MEPRSNPQTASTVPPIMFTGMGMRRLEETDAPSQTNAEQQSCRQAEAIVGVKCNLRQKVGQSDAQKDARGKCQGASNDRALLVQNAAQSPSRGNRPERRQHRKT